MTNDKVLIMIVTFDKNIKITAKANIKFSKY